MTDVTVAVLGLGAMGLPMATHLAQDFSVKAFDPFQARRDLAQEVGAQACVSAAEASKDVDVAVIAVRSAPQVEAVLFGTDGAAKALKQGSVVVVTSTVGAECVLDMETRLAALGVGLVDAPVSGGAVRAGDGELLIMLGGSQESLAAARPVLQALGSHLVDMGECGAGQNMKAVNQLLCGIHTAAAAEALAMAKTLGLDPMRCIEVMGTGVAASFMLADRGPRMVEQMEGRTPELRSRLDVILKDMGIVGSLTRVAQLPTPVASAAENLYRVAKAAGLEAEDDSALAAYLLGQARV
ncbi:NAD(P)-dependent oxidoreductase [Actinomyces urogenitalis]|uniref:NAD(P)-dependent oxidoreductase n=1 Tax=Actinomyces urogenitalis TaxID=103621 RepID=UPI00050DC3BC|nr:NAD(P)-dependent oxidoreductase [Actinomyces urogenitalis]KGF04026.1 oxidoreductase [Actinomyces urogenitalis S6-C4]MDU0863882.1 NAD(P)-dependent oxidoreductase [Actinomyces urogenitalis]MDU0874534.1 NAD(P)-dependent oxidoreductase [Actinomyces urogenitalis]MDU1564068.1 NAD(P)-dependent oxidoreductase [Actinomyces urogenitalis]MDU1639547.1 NAD(P)-dependent oxidoreductase [Actinomyces urogenitalis]